MEHLSEYREYLQYEQCRSPHTIRGYIADIEEFTNWIERTGGGMKPDSQITAGDIRNWLGKLSRDGKATTSIKRRLQSLRSYYGFLCRKKKLSINPAADVPAIKLSKRLPEFIKPEEIEELLTRLYSKDEGGAERKEEKDNPTIEGNQDPQREITEFRDALIIELLYTSGMRRSELLSLTDNDIDFSKSELKVMGKRKKQRIIPLASDMLEKISEWQKMRNREWTGRNEPRRLMETSKGSMSESTLYRIVRHQLSGIKATRKSPHALRHTFATAMLNGGTEITDIKEFLGHSSLSTTQIYTHVSYNELIKTYKNSHPRSTTKEGKS